MNRMFVNIVKTNTITFCARVFIVVILVVFLHSASGWSYEVILHFINNAREFMLTFSRQVIQWTKWGGEWKERKKKCKKNAKILVAHVFAQVFIRSIVPSFLRSSCSSPFRCIQTKTNEPYIAFASIYYGYVALKTT